MATGRMLQRKISSNKQIPRLISLLDDRMGAPHGAYAAVLYTWCLAHLDVSGRMNGDIHVVKGQVAPRIPFVTPDNVEHYLTAMQEVGLVEYYEADGDRWLAFLGFDRNQPHLRRDRETPSSVPPPECGKRIAGVTETATPAEIRSDAGVTPAEVSKESNKYSSARTREIDCKKFQDRWLECTGDIGANGLYEAGLACNDYSRLVGMLPNEYADKAIPLFVEWAQNGCPPGKRPPLIPRKFAEHIAHVHQMVIGKRKPVEAEDSPLKWKPAPDERARPKLFTGNKYADGES